MLFFLFCFFLRLDVFDKTRVDVESIGTKETISTNYSIILNSIAYLSESKLFSNKVLTNMSEVTNEESYISGFNNLYFRQR